MNPLVDRIWEKVQVDPITGCWLWLGATDGRGYGQIRFGGSTKRLIRVVYEMVNDIIDPTKDVCHRCDIRRCINPFHLFQGTRLENMQDAVRKDRIQKGEDRPLSKLTVITVKQAYTLRQQGWTYDALATKFNVGNPTIWKALNGQTWKHVSL
jgi:hypothetical protein